MGVPSTSKQEKRSILNIQFECFEQQTLSQEFRRGFQWPSPYTLEHEASLTDPPRVVFLLTPRRAS